MYSPMDVMPFMAQICPVMLAVIGVVLGIGVILYVAAQAESRRASSGDRRQFNDANESLEQREVVGLTEDGEMMFSPYDEQKSMSDEK